MSDLKNLVLASMKTRSELVATTVRIPQSLQAVIEELAEYLSLSKQDIMLKLLEEGANIAEQTIADALAQTESTATERLRFHVLNTNKRHNIDDQGDMLREGIAAAFYGRCKLNIDRIQQGDIVFLYENGVGIIAYGKGSGQTLKKDRYGDKDECHYQKLSDFVILEQPISASQTKKILGRNVVFLRTMSSMPDGQKLLDFISVQ